MKLQQIIFLAGIIVGYSQAALAQETEEEEPDTLEYGIYSGYTFLFTNIAYNLNTYNSLELRMIYGVSAGGYGLLGLSAGSEFIFTPRELTFAPKIAAEIHILAVGMKLNTLYYINSKGNSLKIRPEIGVGLAGYFYILYGYSIAVTHKDFLPLKHHFTVGVNLPTAKRWKSRFFNRNRRY
jgi:hypothetical protein